MGVVRGGCVMMCMMMDMEMLVDVGDAVLLDVWIVCVMCWMCGDGCFGCVGLWLLLWVVLPHPTQAVPRDYLT